MNDTNPLPTTSQPDGPAAETIDDATARAALERVAPGTLERLRQIEVKASTDLSDSQFVELEQEVDSLRSDLASLERSMGGPDVNPAAAESFRGAVAKIQEAVNDGLQYQGSVSDDYCVQKLKQMEDLVSAAQQHMNGKPCVKRSMPVLLHTSFWFSLICIPAMYSPPSSMASGA